HPTLPEAIRTCDGQLNDIVAARFQRARWQLLTALLRLPSGDHFRQRIVLDGLEPQSANLLKPAPTARYACFFSGHISGVEVFFGKCAVIAHRFELRINDKLSKHRIATNMAFAEEMESLRTHFPQYVAQI